MSELHPHLPNAGDPTGPRAGPDDTEYDAMIAEATSLQDALFTIADKYGAAVTNNEPRFQDGRYLREVGSFIGDVMDATARFTASPGDERAAWDAGFAAGFQESASGGQADATDANPYRVASTSGPVLTAVETSLPVALAELLNQWDSHSEDDNYSQGEAANDLRAALRRTATSFAGLGREPGLPSRPEPMGQLIQKWLADRDTTSRGAARVTAAQVFDTCVVELIKAVQNSPRTADSVWALIPTWLSYRGQSERGEVHASGFEAYGTCLANLLVALQSTQRSASEGILPGCAGDHGCPAPAHQHGCLSDLDGHCNEPAEHRLIITPRKLHDEFEYRLRTTAAHYRMAGKHHEPVPDSWLTTQIDGAVNTLGGSVGRAEDPRDVERPAAPAKVVLPPVGSVPPRLTVTHEEVIEAARPFPDALTYQQVIGFLARLGVQVFHDEVDHA